MVLDIMIDRYHPLKRWRRRNKATQAALGARMGVDALTVSRWERCKSLPRRGLWPKLKEETGVSITELIEAAGSPPVDPESV